MVEKYNENNYNKINNYEIWRSQKIVLSGYSGEKICVRLMSDTLSEAFDSPGADNIIELNGRKSELVICTLEEGVK